MATFDYIVVGAGSAGCVIANRLSRHFSVLVLEAGGPDSHPLIPMPMGIGKTLSDPTLSWIYQTEPDAMTGKQQTWLRGKVLGGSSSINGMLYFHGQPQDYDGWAEMGLEDWGWGQMSAAFQEMENHSLGANENRGGRGPLNVGIHSDRTPLTAAILEAGACMGLPIKEDLNEPDQEGIGYSPCTIHRGKRVSSAKAFLRPAMQRSSVEVRTNVQVNRIIMENNAAVGVEAMVGGRIAQFHCNREVIVCAGALQSPVLLQLSGIGPADHLAKIGVPLVVDSPDVGANLREHKTFSLQYRIKGPHSINSKLHGWRLGWSMLRYLLTRTGPMAATYDINAFVRSRPDLDRPDGQLTFWSLSFDYDSPTYAAESHPGLMVMGYPLRADSRGTVMARSANPADPPVIVANFLTTEHDRSVIIGLTRYTMRIMESPSLAPFLERQSWPRQTLVTDADILEACANTGTCFHAVGTCRMGSDVSSVVDGRLRVRGVDRLRVVDCSVMPTQVSGNTNGPVMALAWNAAKLILRDSNIGGD